MFKGLRAVENCRSRGHRKFHLSPAYIVRKTWSTDGKTFKYKRHPYLRRYRHERKILRTVDESTVEFLSIERKLLRRLYYRTLPVLYRKLGWAQDREILTRVERNLYEALLVQGYLYIRRKPKRLRWSLRMYPLQYRKYALPRRPGKGVALASSSHPSSPTSDDSRRREWRDSVNRLDRSTLRFLVRNAERLEKMTR